MPPICDCVNSTCGIRLVERARAPDGLSVAVRRFLLGCAVSQQEQKMAKIRQAGQQRGEQPRALRLHRVKESKIVQPGSGLLVHMNRAMQATKRDDGRDQTARHAVFGLRLGLALRNACHELCAPPTSTNHSSLAKTPFSRPLPLRLFNQLFGTLHRRFRVECYGWRGSRLQGESTSCRRRFWVRFRDRAEAETETECHRDFF